MNVLDLFSGIGGFSLGLERAGMRTVAFCEIDARCRRVLAYHWPDVPIYEDICDLTGTKLAAAGIKADIICGGFPCQDISSAADAPAGIDGLRSGLWREFARLIREIRPQFAIVENVSALLVRGIDRVLGDLAALGYDAEWHCIPASAVGAPHPRDRVWIVAYAPEMLGPAQRRNQSFRILSRDGFLSIVENEGWPNPIGSWWASEPNVDRLVHGVPDRVDRFGELSNAVVPQIPEIIGRSIMSANKQMPT
jgi:DNA (cytosine-5)-methyltransferase 1